MLDIDFFRSEISLNRPIVYRYRTGRFRPTFKRILSEHPEAVALGFLAFRPDDPDAHVGGLFSDVFRYCDWLEAGYGGAEPPLSNPLFQELAEGKRTFTADLFRVSKKLDKDVDWAAIRSHCLVIEEAAVTPGLRARYVDYLLSVSAVIGGDTRGWRPTLDAHLDELMTTEAVDLNRLAKEIDTYVLGHIDPRNNLPIEEAEIEANVARLVSVGSSLRRFIRSGDTYDLVQLVSAAARHMEGRASSHLVAALYRSTWQLLLQHVENDTDQPARAPRLRSVGDRNLLRRLILWSATMLGWDERLNWYETEPARELIRGPDATIVVVENMCRDFLARSSRDALGEHCLEDLWSACNHALQIVVNDDVQGIPYHRAKMVELLAAATSPPSCQGWLSELGRAASAADTARRRREATEANKQPQTVHFVPKPEPYPQLPWRERFLDPGAFDQILARISPGELLRQRVQQGVRPNAMIFHGAAGVGKGTAARLFAQAILCDQKAANGAPCAQCVHCNDVLTGGGFIFGNGRLRKYNGPKDTEVEAKKIIEYLEEKANGPSLTDGRVIIVENISLAGLELERLVKTLEDSPIVFVLTARLLKEVPPAIRSRCELYEMKPVDAAGTRAWFSRLFVGKAAVDERALDVLVAMSRGAPGEIVRTVEALADCERITLEGVLSKFGLDWPQRLAKDWADILDTSESGWLDLGAMAELPVREMARRARAALLYALAVKDGRIGHHIGSDPALMHLDEATSLRWANGLRHAAVRHDMTDREYARKAAGFWESYEPLLERYPASD